MPYISQVITNNRYWGPSNRLILIYTRYIAAELANLLTSHSMPPLGTAPHLIILAPDQEPIFV